MEALEGHLKHLRNYDGTKAKKKQPAEEHATKPKTTKVVRPTPPALLEMENDEQDMVSYQRNILLLQQQAKKVAPSQHIVNELMKKTFQVRRKLILSNPCKISELVKTYPCLKSDI